MTTDNNNEQPSMLSVFPAEELKRMMLHLDRFDTEVVTDEKLKTENAATELEKVSEEIIQDNL
jgi:hypothetical protein